VAQRFLHPGADALTERAVDRAGVRRDGAYRLDHLAGDVG
jgi:hypothetical protein